MPPATARQRPQAAVRQGAAALLRQRRRAPQRRRVPDQERRARPLPRRDRAAAARRATSRRRADARRARRPLPRAARRRSARRARSTRCANGMRTPLERVRRRAARRAGEDGGELADWRATLPPGTRSKVMGALRQVLAAGVRWRLHRREPGRRRRARTRDADPAPVRVYTLAELDAIAAELSTALPAAARVRAPRPGYGPRSGRALERRHVDRARRLVRVEQKNVDGRDRARRQDEGQRARGAAVRRARSPRSTRSRRGSTRRCCSRRPKAGRSTSTTSAAANGRPPSRPPASETPGDAYDLRDTFASNALAAGVTVFELARVMGTRVRMIERHYGALLDGAHAGIADRLDALEAPRAAERWQREGGAVVKPRILRQSSRRQIQACPTGRFPAAQTRWRAHGEG